MRMASKLVGRAVSAATLLAVAVGLVGIASAPGVYAMGTEAPADPCVKFKKGGKAWKDCRRNAGLPTEARPEVDEAATLGYALTKAGRHAEALDILKPHEASGDVRVLTYIGFAERKLGRIDAAMGYYRRALDIAPDNVATLEYLGEAHLQKGDVAAAKATLDRIAGLCGSGCEAYRTLERALATSTGHKG